MTLITLDYVFIIFAKFIKLDKFGKDYEYIIKGDEGHGFRSEVANLALYEDYEKFLAKHLIKN